MLVIEEKSTVQLRSEVLPRLGQINFVNCLPVVVPMRRSDWQHKAEVFYATPSDLNYAFAQNKLDIGAMSSFHYLLNGTLQLVDGLSISSDGAVASVMCYSKKPLGELHNACIAVPTSSATSINLLCLLLLEVFGAVPQLTYTESPNIDDPRFDAVLVIGDQALKAELLWSKKLVRADLGEWWRIVTGLPMVFGVWAAGKEWAARNPEQFVSIADSLRSAAASGLSSDLEAVIAEGCSRTGMSTQRIHQYFTRDLNYELTDRHLQGLARYGELCAKHGLFNQNR
jgi:chorismate dehydratase